MSAEDRSAKGGNWVGAPAFYELNEACRSITDVFGYHVYLVGSALKKRDWRDVDVRCMLPDADFDRTFGTSQSPAHNPWLSLLTISISAWLKNRTGLPVDFQFQRQTEAAREYTRAAGHGRHPLGLFLETPLYRRSIAMSLEYHNRGDDVILHEASTAAFQLPDEAIVAEVSALAKKNVAETGRPCDVYAVDEATVLLRERPAKP
jgi:hypothetical protein